MVLPILWSWRVPSAPRELWRSQSSLCGISLGFCVEAVQLICCLSRGTALSIGVHLMCYWEGAKSVFFNTRILDLPLTLSVFDVVLFIFLFFESPN